MNTRQISGTCRSGLISRFWGARHASVMLVALAVTMSGCALQQQENPSGSIMGGPTQGTQLSAKLTGFLNQATPGSVVLKDSPWGSNVEVMADKPYYSASGRTCRKLQIISQQRSNTRAAVACQTADGSWVSQRLVTKVREKGATQ